MLDELGGTEDLQPLPQRVGDGLQHAVQDVEALRVQRRHRRPVHHLLADRASRPGARSATSTTTRSTSCPTILDAARRRAARDDQGPRAEPTSTASACATASTTASAPSARKTQFYSMLGSRGIWHDGWKAVTTHPTHQRLGPLQRGHLGALPHRRRPGRAARPRRRAPGQAPRAGQPVVRRGGRQRRLPARRPVRRWRSSSRRGRSSAAPREPLRLLPGHRRGARVAGGQHPQPLLRDRRAGRHPRARRRRGCCSRTGPASAGTPSTSRTTGCTTSTTSSAASEQKIVAERRTSPPART